ncbi:ABC transporter permease [Alienimonas californiensis]|uniref:Macrolide export ATP-binding/permease protein MacB n=1 Tax=Alienimonas californiensis TaxID=2527989 RepID=A0A517P5D2_9PLAN|nr:ABC transporter permease [Alienimonas californiensis]QDT14583.1 Macrolide export ATP-binding/permease protein MacB [Alienimonas californiensis]
MSPVGLIRAVKFALKSLMLHKLRSGLTMLGIVLGVCSVIAMLAIGEGASAQAQRQVIALGATNVIVRTVKPPPQAQESGGGRVADYGLRRIDFRRLEALDNVMRAVPIREAAQEFRRLQEKMNGRLVGVTPDYAALTGLNIARGRFIADRDRAGSETVCVLSAGAREQLFGLDDPLGDRVRVGEVFYKVVGIAQPRGATGAVGGSLSGQEFDKDIYIPIDTFETRIGDLIIQRNQGGSTYERVELNQITLQVNGAEHVMPTAAVVRETLALSHPQRDYAVVVPQELLEQAEQIKDIFNIVLGSIAAISLVVGGIGIMNIMLATVTERTREIGIRRALGARQGDILQQFLTETIVLSGAGGVAGILLGMSTPLAFRGVKWAVQTFVLESSPGDRENAGGGPLGGMLTDLEPQLALWSLPVSFLISVGIGVIFGILPARNAARLDPIEALRHE